jgi:two-component system, NtrC family, response regulator AtoC
MARILVVDDEEGLRDFVIEALERDGHRAIGAENGQAALVALGRQSFDLMVTDLRMPGPTDGMTLLRRARSDAPEMEVVVLTAYGTIESAVEAMRLGAFDYLQKPIGSPTQLRLIVERALERRSLLALKDRSVREAPALPPLTYGDPEMEPVVAMLRKVAPTDTTVLLLGESGTGKEVAARTIHALSARSTGPFVAVSCAAVAETIIESELFGHEKGAFTGATAAKRGRVELADGGTLFLDEIGELKPELQTKLLRVVQERQFERVGGTRTLVADVRWIAATNRELESMLVAGTFREDLYHRLAVFPVRLPPLRDRRGDLVPLAMALLARIGNQLNRPGLHLDEDGIAWIAQADWPGNVRELANALERAAILADGDLISAEDLVPDRQTAPPVFDSVGTIRPIAQIEREAIRQALVASDGNRRVAAERLGIGLRTLYEKLKRHRLG